jgi:molybdopterin-guanine dinucleotide biosynthesis protein A
MGTSKALLEWHGSTLVRHIVDILRGCVDGPVIVVRAPGQELPPLPASVRIVEDTRPGTGPLDALASGLAAAEGHADRAIVCGVDTPFLTPRFAAVLIDAMREGVDIVVPAAEGRRHPIPAVVRVALHPIARALVDDGQRALFALVDRCATVDVDEARLRAVDPTLASLRNLNERSAYETARAEPADATPTSVGSVDAGGGAHGTHATRVSGSA